MDKCVSSPSKAHSVLPSQKEIGFHWLPCKTNLISSLGYLANTNHAMDTAASCKVRTDFKGSPQAVDL